MSTEEKIRLGIAATMGAAALIMLLGGGVIPILPLEEVGGALPL
ncbi:MAG: hypothetical protein QXX95_05465 [Nitrososphaerales archaeon]